MILHPLRTRNHRSAANLLQALIARSARNRSSPLLWEADMNARCGTLIVAASLAMLTPAVLSAQDTTKMMMGGVKVATTSLGPTLVDAKGMTLYTWGNDSIPGKSLCNAQCASNWPPLVAGADAQAMGDWTIVTRDDGTKQWAYKGKPLYTYRSDAKAGDVTGNGRGRWAAAKP
jgi:predicted lipoprotein with Yx(FWY)xxD motif